MEPPPMEQPPELAGAAPPGPGPGPGRPPCCSAAAVAWALLSCALLAALAALLLLLPPPSPQPPPPQSGARLVLVGPGRIMKSGKLAWYADNRMDGVFLGPGFEYNSKSHTLEINNDGLYSIYAQLSAVHIRKSSPEKGNATLTIHRKTARSSAPILTLPLHLSSHSSKWLAAFAAVSPYRLGEGDSLYVTLTVSGTATEGGHNATQWYFGNGTVFGLSLISGNLNLEATGIDGCSPAPRKWSGF